MRNLILVAVILQLAIIIIGINGYEFGDIISFERKCICKLVTYKHFAVYVGTAEFEGKEPGQDIFHRTGKVKKGFATDCQFGVLKNESGTPQKDNYLERRYPIFTNRSVDEITHQINVMNTAEGCGTYSLGFNNCEHLATAVRYGWSVSKQEGTTFRIFCQFNQPRQCTQSDHDQMQEIMKTIDDNAEKETNCLSSCPDKAS